jgi:single-strand DNA-binding protein
MFNKIMVIGNIGTEPEMRYTPNGNPVTSFRIATSRSYTSANGERNQETEWFTVVAWNQLAERCNQYLAKGRRTFVEGRLQSRQWDGQDGQTRHRNEIVASNVVFLDRNPSQPSENEPSTLESNDSSVAIETDDLPF